LGPESGYSEGTRRIKEIAVIRQGFGDPIPAMNSAQKPIKKVQKSENRLMRLIGRLIPAYRKSVVTTYGGIIYLPDEWPKYSELKRKIILAHEEVHARQQEKYPKLLYLLLYFFALPIFWNPFRLSWEREAFEKTIEITAEIHGLAYVQSQDYRDYIAKNFYSATYGWMWPNKRAVYTWVDQYIQGLSVQNPQ
jgi:hypothetical protein